MYAYLKLSPSYFYHLRRKRSFFELQTMCLAGILCFIVCCMGGGGGGRKKVKFSSAKKCFSPSRKSINFVFISWILLTFSQAHLQVLLYILTLPSNMNFALSLVHCCSRVILTIQASFFHHQKNVIEMRERERKRTIKMYFLNKRTI